MAENLLRWNYFTYSFFAFILSEWQVTRKKKGCPAVTLTTQVQSVTISLDIVLCLMVKSSWPFFTNDGFLIENWLGTKVKQEYRRKPYYLVPKYKGRGTDEKDGVFAKGKSISLNKSDYDYQPTCEF